jgi:hypothetical protein
MNQYGPKGLDIDIGNTKKNEYWYPSSTTPPFYSASSGPSLPRRRVPVLCLGLLCSFFEMMMWQRHPEVKNDSIPALSSPRWCICV